MAARQSSTASGERHERRYPHPVGRQARRSDPRAAQQLLPLVYDELRRLAARKLAHEKPGQTLDATALVHEAYLRLVGKDTAQRWDSRGHFFAAAAEAMRRILVNRARDKKRIKRGGGRKRIDLDQIQIATDTPSDDLLALDEALEKLAAEDSVAAELVKLRFFGGLTLGEASWNSPPLHAPSESKLRQEF